MCPFNALFLAVPMKNKCVGAFHRMTDLNPPVRKKMSHSAVFEYKWISRVIYQNISVSVSSQDNVVALGNISKRSAPSLQSFPMAVLSSLLSLSSSQCCVL